ncbi:YdcF family protein [Zoogloea sp.]|uniref:YdcF family protein n=1 Tax=Zoogloea sp. TaxID=49181 RepID=UPI001415FBAC|nr:MAG: YdcF family protein [Zoogloea sp.]
MFLLKKILSTLVLPPFGPLLIILAGLVLGRRHPRTGRLLAGTGLVVSILLMTPASVGLLLADLENYPPITDDALAQADAIVILAGGMRSHAPEFGEGTVNSRTLERIRYGARLAHKSGLPVLVSGGAPLGRTAEAEWMKVSLQEDFGVAVRWVEDRSLDTQDNARFSARILQPEGYRRIALVTHAAHMRRAEAWFRSAGFEVLPAPTAYLTDPRADGPDDTGLGATSRFLQAAPSMSAAYAGWYAIHEWLGLLAFRLNS